MNEKERNAISIMLKSYNTDFNMQDEDKVRKNKKEFINDFSTDVTEKPHYILQLLEIAYREKNAEDVELSLSLASMFDSISKEYSTILIKLLKADWHYKHEDIVLIFQKLKIPEAVDVIYETAMKRFKYLEYDDNFTLARKCTWALAKINTAESIEKLRLLAQSNNDVVKEYALKRL
jgi:hypothetical protein